MTSISPFGAESHFLDVFGKENRIQTVSEERKKKKTRKRIIRKITRIVNNCIDLDIDLDTTRNYYPWQRTMCPFNGTRKRVGADGPLASPPGVRKVFRLKVLKEFSVKRWIRTKEGFRKELDPFYDT